MTIKSQLDPKKNVRSVWRRFRRRVIKRNNPDTIDQRLPDVPAACRAIIRDVLPMTMTSPERIAALCSAVGYVIDHEIPGDIVECGVWRGGSMMAVARTLLAKQSTERTLWLYDTFQGMTEPTPVDVDHTGKTAQELLDREDRSDPASVWCVSHLDEVRTNMRSTRYPLDRLCFVPGRVEQTLAVRRPEQIALLRLDTDWYESTRQEMRHLFPLLSPGGVLIVDDYGHWRGCRQAVDEYLQEHGIAMFLQRIDYTGRIGVYYPNDRDQESTTRAA